MAYDISSGQTGSMNSGIVSNGGIQFIPDLLHGQIVYLDFDGELTRYDGEILTVDNVAVEDSGLTAERIGKIVEELNRQFEGLDVRFVTERPKTSAYSTVYVGKTSAFDPFERFEVPEAISFNFHEKCLLSHIVYPK